MKNPGPPPVKNVCKTCGKGAEILWIRGGEACGILVGKRWKDGGNVPFRPFRRPRLKLLEIRIVTHDIVLSTGATTRSCGHALDFDRCGA